MTAEEQREAHLGHFEAAEFDPAGRLPLAGPRPAVARRRGAAAGSRLEKMPDERLAYGNIGARVRALAWDAETAAPASHCTLGAGRRQRLDDRLDDLLAAMIGGERDRRPGIGPDHRARLSHQRDRAEGSLVLRRLRVDQIG